MRMFRRTVFLCILPLVLLACETPPETVEPEAEEPVSAPVVIEEPVSPPAVVVAVEEPPPAEPEPPPPPPEPEFDPATVSVEVYQATKVDIQHLVENLNRIIRAKNFNSWVSYLSEECLAERSSPVFLEAVSKGPRLQNQKPLTDVRDYFMRVVVPSRDHDRVDDIEFINQHRVKAYTVNARGDRLRLYDLEYNGSGWKIID